MQSDKRKKLGMRRHSSAVTRLYGGFYLSPQQFGYTTAQEPLSGFAGGAMSTATAGAGEGSGGASAGGGAA